MWQGVPLVRRQARDERLPGILFIQQQAYLQARRGGFGPAR